MCLSLLSGLIILDSAEVSVASLVRHGSIKHFLKKILSVGRDSVKTLLCSVRSGQRKVGALSM